MPPMVSEVPPYSLVLTQLFVTAMKTECWPESEAMHVKREGGRWREKEVTLYSPGLDLQSSGLWHTGRHPAAQTGPGSGASHLPGAYSSPPEWGKTDDCQIRNVLEATHWIPEFFYTDLFLALSAEISIFMTPTFVYSKQLKPLS